MIADRLHEVERTILGEIVEEDAADAARLVAVLQVEIFVAPFLEPRVVAPCRFLADGVEMPRILLEAVVRREVHAAAEPRGVTSREVADVQMDRGAVMIARMQDERNAHRFPRTAGELRARRGGG